MEKLENHDHEPKTDSSQTQAQAEPSKQTPRKPKWDPLARYHSDASSFPDYGDRRGDMAKRNLKGLNPTTSAHNSLNRPGGRNTTTEPPNKRQRLGSSPSSNVRLASFTPNSNKLRLVESNRDGKDLYEIGSNTTDAGSGKQSARATQSEYRDTQSIGDPRKKRVRKSRQRLSVGVSSRESPSVDSESPTSPDPLGQDPSPSNIASDIAASRGGAKRERQPSISEPHVKRPKATSTRRESVDNLADELSWDSSSKPVPRRTGPLAGGPSSERHGGLRGDIVPTAFSSAKAKPQACARKQEKPFAIKRAVGGSLLIQSTSVERYSLTPSYNNDGKAEELHLRLEKVDAEGNALNKLDVEDAITTCMAIEFGKVTGVHHDITRSEFAMVSRRLSPGQPPKLFIEFSSVAECSRLVGLFPVETCHLHSSDELEKKFNYGWETAMKRQESPKETSASHEQSQRPSGPSRQRLIVEIPARREPRSKARLIDRMSGADEETKEQRVNSDLTDAPSGSTPAPPSHSPRVRRTRGSMATSERRLDEGFSYFDPQPSVSRWTVENPDWESRWSKSLVYPAAGKNRTVVDADDIPRLDDGQCLNDNIINFYLRWLKTKVEGEDPSALKKVHIFESYFFERLKTSKYQGVRNWTTKLDLLSYDYIVVPVNESYHWYLAIICNVAKALPGGKAQDDNKENPATDGETQDDDSSKVTVVQERVKAISIDDDSAKSSSTVKNNVEDPYHTPSTPPSTKNAASAPKPKGKKSSGPPPQKFDPNEPRIITLDSLGGPHSPTCRILREYLAAEALDKKNVELEVGVPGMTAKGIPLQGNGFDCGTYTLAFIERFLRDPDEVSRQLLQKETLDWEVDSDTMRRDIRELLFTLQDEQQERLRQELAEKKARRRSKSLAAGDAMSSPGPVMVPTASQEASREAASKNFASSPTGRRGSAHPGETDGADGEEQSTPVVVESHKPDSKPRSVPIDDEEPTLISPLVNSGGNTPDGRLDAFFSARTTPAPKTNGKSQPSSSNKPSAKDVPPQPSLVEEISSSDSEPEEVAREETKPKEIDLVEREPVRPSIEKDQEDPVRPSTEQDEERPPKSSGGFMGLFKFGGNVWGSKEKKKRASYDGIDRS